MTKEKNNIKSIGENPKDVRFPAPKEMPVTFHAGEKQIIGILHMPEGKTDEKYPCIVMVHGFAGDKSTYRLFVRAAREFAANGFAALRFDSRGCGDSEGFAKDYTMSTKLEDIGEAVKFAKSVSGVDRIGLVGISYGGAASVIFAARNKDIKCVDAWAPGTLSEGFGPAVKEEIIRRGFINFGYFGGKVHKSQLEDDMKYDMYREVKKVNAPIQITHGTKDSMVPFVEGEKLFQNANEPKKFNAVEGADHSFASHKRQLIASSVEWFKKWLF